MGAVCETAVLFDLDGVLVDSRAPISRCIRHALDTHGLPQQSVISLERFIGPPLTRAFAEMTGQAEDSTLVLDCLASYRARYREVSLRETTVFPGIPEALGVLAGQHRLAVATSKPTAFAEPLLSAMDLRHNFEHVAGPELDAHREDKATTIKAGFAALGVSRAVMVGDRSFDILGAHACGLPAVGVTWGIGSVQELTDSGADLIVDDPEDLPGAIDELL
jgi:phosphoglycolate phosphatase